VSAQPGPEFVIRHPLGALDEGDLRHPVRVICVAQTRTDGLKCRQQLATIYEATPGSILARLYMPNGWREDKDGLWRVSGHALARFRAGQAPRDRRPSGMASRGNDGPVFPQQEPKRWPFVAVCPECNHHRTFDKAVLRLPSPLTLPPGV
jgi:hypothetical protein